MKNKMNGVDMDAAIKYMVKHDCRLDEAIAAVAGKEVVEKPVEKTTPPPKKVVEKPAIVAKTKLKAVRIAAGLSQSELAKKADLNLRTLQAYEQGYKTFDNARIDTILKVALYCGCKLEDIIEDEDYLELLRKYMEIVV